MSQPDTAEIQADFGALLIERGLISPQQLEEAIRIQRLYAVSGREPVPRIGEILVERGILGEREVSEVLAAQNKAILYCPRCDIQVNVQNRADAEGYKCSRCQGLLDKPSRVRTIKVVDSSIILISREPVPDEVREALKDPARKFGKYVLLGEIGRGGVAIIHRAWDTYLSQMVALKFIKTEPEREAARGDRKHDTRILELMKEARSAVRLRHPNIVTVYEVGKVDRIFYISMELLEGGTLADLIRHARDQGKISPFYDEPKRQLSLLRDVARAVHYAHTRPTPLVHCDLKPGNIFVTKAGRPCVLDFGLARELRRDGAGTDTERLVRGTPSYMAPEQAAGKSSDIDVRTDVYSLGTILYEMLAGRPPFTGELFDVLNKVITLPPARPTEFCNPAQAAAIPPAVERMALRCLEKDRGLRYPTARDFADDLDRAIRGEPFNPKTTRRHPGPMMAVRPARKVATGPLLAAGAAAVVLLGVLLAGRGGDAGSELRRIRQRADELIASLQTDEARRLWAESSKAVGSAETRDWIEGERVEIDWVEKLRKALVESVNRTRPRLPALAGRDRSWKDAELLKATEEKLVVFTEGRTLEVRWEALAPRQVLALAETQLGNPIEIEPRFGLALYCLKSGLPDEARRLFQSLERTSLGIYAQKHLAKIGAAPK